MEDVEDVIVSSGPNTWPNWRNFSDRIIKPGDIVFMDLAALTWNGYKSCYYRTYCVGKEPTQEQKDVLRDGAQVALRLDQGGEGRHDHARDRLASGRRPRKPGATRKRTRPPPTCGATAWASRSTTRRSSRASGRSTIPVEIKEGMVFALETQHGKIVPVGRAHRGNADRPQGQDRDHLQLPGRADHRRRSDAGLFQLRQDLVSFSARELHRTCVEVHRVVVMSPDFATLRSCNVAKSGE